MTLTNWRWVFAGVDLAECSYEFCLQAPEGHTERFWPCEDYIIMTWPCRKRFEQPQRFFETPPDPVAPDRAAGLFGHGEPKPWRRIHARRGI